MGKAQQFNFMQLDEQLQKVADEYGFIDPLTLLLGFANGEDLRGHSLVYQWILNHENINGDEPPDTFEWDELVELIKNEHRFLPVERAVSRDAAKTLLEYQHNKKKSVEITDKSASGEITELSRAEIKRFERVFKHEY